MTTAPPRRRVGLRRWQSAVLEALAALGSAVAFTGWAKSIDDNPVIRVGQISGLAALHLRTAVVVIPMLVVLGLVLCRAGASLRALAARIAAAALAGLSTGFLAAGQVFALQGTPWPINGDHGDNGALILMARQLAATGSTRSVYPPAIPYVMTWATTWFHLSHPALVLKPLFIAVLALAGPAAYLAWRLSRGPLVSLALTVSTVLPFVMPYKPYSTLVLVVLLPLLIAFLRLLRVAGTRSRRHAVLTGLGFGLGLGVLYLVYSGWFVWAAPGALVAWAWLFPWRERAARPAAALLTLGAAVGFLVPTLRYLVVMAGGLGLKDTWCSPITLTEPGYLGPAAFATSQWDQPGEWPVLGPFAGLTVFTLILLVGLAVALTVGLRRPEVLVTVAVLAGAWLARFWIASNVERDQATQLFPRTAWVIQICLLVLTVLAVVLVAERAAPLVAHLIAAAGVVDPRRSLAPVGVLAALAVTLAMSGSAMTDQYLPERPEFKTGGLLAWYAHQMERPDGTCPTYADGGVCAPPTPFGPLPKSSNSASPTSPANFLQTCEYPWRKAGG